MDFGIAQAMFRRADEVRVEEKGLDLERQFELVKYVVRNIANVFR